MDSLEHFNYNQESIWESRIFSLSRNGKIFIAKAVFTGFKIDKEFLKIGPFTLRKYKKEDEIIDTWGTGAKRIIVELKYRDRATKKSQNTPVSMFIEPSYLLTGFFYTTQLIVNGWVGMSIAKHFNLKGEIVSQFGSHATQLADSFHAIEDPTVDNLNKKNIAKYTKALNGKCSAAVRRYSRGCGQLMEDAIVDFVIVMESLLGNGLESGFSHRLATRCALLLGGKNKREDYYALFKYLYDLRSKLIHGETNRIFAPSNSQKAFLERLGFKPDVSANDFMYRYHVAELARNTSRKILLYFINNPNHLNNDWLRKLELGVVKADSSLLDPSP